MEPTEAEAVRAVFARRIAGETNGQIARWLNESGFETRNGNPWTAHAVRDLLACRFFLGVVRYRADEFPGLHEAIIDPGTYDLAGCRHVPRRRVRLRAEAQAVLRGRVLCARCGHPLHCETNAGGHVLYRERHACTCETNGRAVSARRIDEAVGELVTSVELPERWQQDLLRRATATRGNDLDRLLDRRRRLARAYADGGLDHREYEQRLAEIDDALAGAAPAPTVRVQEVAELVRHLPALWEAATVSERQRLVEPLIEHVRVDLGQKCLVDVKGTRAFELLARSVSASSRATRGADDR